MLPFPVTICPDEEDARILGLVLDVVRDGFLVLVNRDLRGSFEQLAWLTGLPASESMVKIKTCQVTQDARHDNSAMSPWSKVEIEFVVLHILATLDVVSTNVASSEVLGNCLGDGRLLRHAEDLLWHCSSCLRCCVDENLGLKDEIASFEFQEDEAARKALIKCRVCCRNKPRALTETDDPEQIHPEDLHVRFHGVITTTISVLLIPASASFTLPNRAPAIPEQHPVWLFLS